MNKPTNKEVLERIEAIGYGKQLQKVGNAPREFWIKESFRGHETGTVYPHIIATEKPVASGLIHVIEYSAFEAKVTELEELQSKLPTFIKLDPTTEQLSRENAYVENAKRNMKDIAELRNANYALQKENAEVVQNHRIVIERHADLNEELKSLKAENIELGKFYRSTCPQCGYAGCIRGKKVCDTELDALKALNEKYEKALDAGQILIDDAYFFKGDVRKLTAWSAFREALAAGKKETT